VCTIWPLYTHADCGKANLILINAGTNDAVRSVDTGNAYGRMKAMLTDIWNSEDMGRSCVILSTLLDIGDPNAVAGRLVINQQYRRLVNDLSLEGKCIVLADMDPEEGPQHGWINTWGDYNGDDHTHPNVRPRRPRILPRD
jgi:lysophospholipase L1-like esterase